MSFFRTRPHWMMLAFHYGLGIVVAWQLLEDLQVGQGRVWSGEFYPLVYVVTSIHKMNPQFLSGETLYNLFWSLEHHGMLSYPGWVHALIDQLPVCRAMAWATIATELFLAVALNFRRSVLWALPIAVVFHLLLAALMAWIWIFSFQTLFALIAFLPDRSRPEAAPALS